MATPLNELIAPLPPPVNPYATSVDWPSVESQIGLRLPDDYKAFIKVYGSVTICHVLGVLHPLVGPSSDWHSDQVRLLQDVIDSVNDGRRNVPYPNYPAAGG